MLYNVESDLELFTYKPVKSSIAIIKRFSI